MSTRKNWNTGTTIRDRANALSASLRLTLQQLVELSEIEERFSSGTTGVVVVSPTPWKWRSPTDEEIALIRRARHELDTWLALGGGFIRRNAPELVADFESHTDLLRSVVDRSRGAAGPVADNKRRVLEYVDETLESQAESLRLAGMIDAQSPEQLIVPDTNALYANPSLDEWEGSSAATLVLTPTVIGELDTHKSQHSNENVRRKALSLTRRFEELRRRGDVVAGVKIAGTLRFRIVPFEPDEDDARYPIENKGASSIRDVKTGVRNSAGEEHEFGAYRAQLIAAGEVSWVQGVGSIPEAWLASIHESVGADGFVYWARFTDSARKRWEVAYDASTRTTEWRRV